MPLEGGTKSHCSGKCHFIKKRFELKWVAVNSNELKLWENDGTGLKIFFEARLKIALTPISIAGNMVNYYDSSGIRIAMGMTVTLVEAGL